MLTLPLEPTDDRANPAFRDAAACTQWLGQLQLTNLHIAHATLRKQLDELNRYPMRGLERLRTLEALRETVAGIQADYARKLVAKKLPLNEDELTVFVAIIGLWQEMVTGYQRCLQAYLADDQSLVQYGALLCQRCLAYSGSQIFEHLRTGYEVDGKLWQQLHTLYAFSEEQGLQLDEVMDELSTPSLSSCRAVYVKTLLACYSRPAELTRNRLQLLDSWLVQWCRDITVERSYSTSRGDAPPLAVDLDSTRGLQPTNHPSSSGDMRYLAMVPLSKQLRVLTILLQQGQSPEQLGLGTGCHATDCVEFLNYLHRSWCEGRDDRHAERHHGTAQQAELCYTLEGIYAHIANKPFKQPHSDVGVDSIARRQLETFGRALNNTNRIDLAEMGLVLETWQIEDESILGARLLREGAVGIRIGLHQLVAVRTADANAFMLGAVNWANVTLSGQLHAGIRYMPGIPQPIAIRATGINLTVSDKFFPALLLPAVPSLHIPSSLIVPRDWFHPGRVIEIAHLDNTRQAVKMGFSVEKGLDYERIGYSELPHL